MPTTHYTTDEIVRLGQQRYERDIQAQVDPRHRGKFLALDIMTGDYEIATRALDAARPLRARHPQAVVYIHRIGFPAVYRLGGVRRLLGS